MLPEWSFVHQATFFIFYYSNPVKALKVPIKAPLNRLVGGSKGTLALLHKRSLTASDSFVILSFNLATTNRIKCLMFISILSNF
jgi:hypothetical protein